MHQGAAQQRNPTAQGAATQDSAGDAAQLARVEGHIHALLVGDVKGSVLPPMARPCFTSGGKRIRAWLALRAGAALRLPDVCSEPWAAACELMHNATLVHDDLQDGDTTRRGQPTLWVAHGAAQAINVGDWLFMLAFRALGILPAEAQHQAGFALTQALAAGMAEVIEGQGIECASRAYFSAVATFPYEAMVRGKTAALFALPVCGAALLAGHNAQAAKRLAAPFAELGVLFQQQDDVLDLWGDKGREVCGADLYEGKLSAIVVTHLRRVPADASWLLPLLAAPRDATDAGQVRRAIDTFEQSGSRAALLGDMQGRGERARRSADPALLPVLDNLIARIWSPIASLRPLGHVEPGAPDAAAASIGPAAPTAGSDAAATRELS